LDYQKICKATNICAKATDFWFTKIAVTHKIRREKRMTLGEKAAAKLIVSRQSVREFI